MTLFPSLPEQPDLIAVFKRFQAGLKPLMEYHDVLLRGPSRLTIGERELIAAYVSGINGCEYCHSAHRQQAEIHGVDTHIFQKLLDDKDNSGISEKLLPILDYVKKLTVSPSSMTAADAQQVYAAGWDEDALYDAICVCALFSFMNRITEGTGCVFDKEKMAKRRKYFESKKDDPVAYRDMLRMVGL